MSRRGTSRPPCNIDAREIKEIVSAPIATFDVRIKAHAPEPVGKRLFSVKKGKASAHGPIGAVDVSKQHIRSDVNMMVSIDVCRVSAVKRSKLGELIENGRPHSGGYERVVEPPDQAMAGKKVYSSRLAAANGR